MTLDSRLGWYEEYINRIIDPTSTVRLSYYYHSNFTNSKLLFHYHSGATTLMLLQLYFDSTNFALILPPSITVKIVSKSAYPTYRKLQGSACLLAVVALRYCITPLIFCYTMFFYKTVFVKRFYYSKQ